MRVMEYYIHYNDSPQRNLLRNYQNLIKNCARSRRAYMYNIFMYVSIKSFNSDNIRVVRNSKDTMRIIIL